MTQPRHVTCPNCGQPSLYSPDNPWRPFCCQRCKLIDLGQWASEQYRIPDNGKSSEAGDEFTDPPEKE